MNPETINQIVVDLALELWGIEISDITLERINHLSHDRYQWIAYA